MNRRQFLANAALTTFALAAKGSFGFQAAPAVDAMLMRNVPSTGEPIPVIGLGTWQTFNPPDINDQALAPLQEVLRLFHESGGRVVDSSPMYGRAEEVTGILSERLRINDDLFLATKVWTEGNQAGIDQMNQSLRRLKREKLELMQVHNLVDWQTHLETLRAWKVEGKFRYIGITHHAPGRFDDLENILRNEKVDFIQLPYSVGMRRAEQRLLPAARDTGTAVLVMRPFEGGTLFRTAREKPLPDFVKPWAQSWAQAFLKFILANDAVTCVLPATSKPQHLTDNVRAGFGRLPDDEERKRLVESFG